MPNNASSRRSDPSAAARTGHTSTMSNHHPSASGPPPPPSLPAQPHHHHHNHHHNPQHHGNHWPDNPAAGRNVAVTNNNNNAVSRGGDIRCVRRGAGSGQHNDGPTTRENQPIQDTANPSRPRRERKPTDPVPPPPVNTSAGHSRPAPAPPQPQQQSPPAPITNDDDDETASPGQPGTGNLLNPELLPDILNAHLPPPYSTLPHISEHASHRRVNVGGGLVGPPPPPPPPLPPPLAHPTAVTSPTSGTSPPRRLRLGATERFPPMPRPPTRRPRTRSSPRGSHYTPEDEPKHCCGVTVTQTVSIRWFIVMIAFVGLCCAVVGTVLGALKATGREHLTVSLLMIGVGIVLITVSGIAWRLTSHDAPSCRMMLGLHSEDPEPNRRFVPRVPPSYGRPHHPFAAMMYPEFQYRPPPPSYQASMQEYRLRLLLLDRHHPAPSAALSPVSPPPTYRSNAGTNTFARPPIHFSRENEYSRPPSYRSRASSVNPCPNSDATNVNQNSNGSIGGTISGAPTGTSGITQLGVHSRDPSLSLSLLSHESLFDVASPTPGSDRRSSSGFGGVVSGQQTPAAGPTPLTSNSSSSLTTRSGPVVTDTRNHNHHHHHQHNPNADVRSPVTRYDSPAGLELSPTVVDSDHQSVVSVHQRSSSTPKIIAADVIASSKTKRLRDCNVVTIVQTNNSSRVLPGDVSRQESESELASGDGAPVQRSSTTHTEMEVLAHL